MNSRPISVLLVEDNPGDARLVRERLVEATDTPFRLEFADRLETSVSRLRQGGIDVVLLDLGLPDSQGLATFSVLHAKQPDLPVVVLSGAADEQLAMEAVQAGAQDYLVKGGGSGQALPRALRYAIERKRAEEQIVQLNRELEKRVAERTAQLEAANQELEAFSYSVSHDLRAPLRTIDGFSKILAEDSQSHLSPEGRGHLQRIRQAARRMTQLIEGLLALSRSGSAVMNVEEVDLSAIAQGVAEELKLASPERNLRFEIAGGLKARGDPALLRAVLDNLIRNAWKFTSKQPEAHIEFGLSKDEAGSPAYFVRDNGAGFDMTHARKLFSPFERLHPQAEFPGSGIGLAIVQRIIRRHGGRIWAAAEVGLGATFCFTLPDDGIPV